MPKCPSGPFTDNPKFAAHLTPSRPNVNPNPPLFPIFPPTPLSPPQRLRLAGRPPFRPPAKPPSRLWSVPSPPSFHFSLFSAALAPPARPTCPRPPANPPGGGLRSVAAARPSRPRRAPVHSLGPPSRHFRLPSTAVPPSRQVAQSSSPHPLQPPAPLAPQTSKFRGCPAQGPPPARRHAPAPPAAARMLPM